MRQGEKELSEAMAAHHRCDFAERVFIFLYHYLIAFTSYCYLPLSDHKSIRTELLVKNLAA